MLGLPDLPGADGSWLPAGLVERLLEPLLAEPARRARALEVLGAPLVGAVLTRLGRPEPKLAAPMMAAAVMGRATRSGAMRLIADLDALSIGCVALKGMATGALLYPHPAYRPLPDVDLLIRDADLGRLARWLASRGWTTRPELLAVRRWGALTRASFAPVAPPDTDLLVDVHREIDDPPASRGLASPGVFEHARRLALDGGVLPVPDSAHVFAILALHAFRDFYEPRGLKGLVDAALLVARHGQTIDWGGVERTAEIGRFVNRLVLYRELVRATTGALAPVFEGRRAPRWAARLGDNMRTLAWTRLPDRDKVLVEAVALDGWSDVVRLYGRRIAGLVAPKSHALPGVPVASDRGARVG